MPNAAVDTETVAAAKALEPAGMRAAVSMVTAKRHGMSSLTSEERQIVQAVAAALKAAA